MVRWTRRKRASAINCEAANRDILLRVGSKRNSSESVSGAGGQQPSAARGRKRAKVFSSPSWQSSSSSLGYSNNEVDQSKLKVGSRVLVVTHEGHLFKATVRKRRYEKNQHEFLIHYDGNKKSTLSWIPLDNISDVLENDDLGSEPPLSNKKRKRGQSASSDDAEEEQCGAYRKKCG